MEVGFLCKRCSLFSYNIRTRGTLKKSLILKKLVHFLRIQAKILPKNTSAFPQSSLASLIFVMSQYCNECCTNHHTTCRKNSFPSVRSGFSFAWLLNYGWSEKLRFG